MRESKKTVKIDSEWDDTEQDMENQGVRKWISMAEGIKLSVQRYLWQGILPFHFLFLNIIMTLTLMSKPQSISPKANGIFFKIKSDITTVVYKFALVSYRH